MLTQSSLLLTSNSTSSPQPPIGPLERFRARLTHLVGLGEGISGELEPTPSKFAITPRGTPIEVENEQDKNRSYASNSPIGELEYPPACERTCHIVGWVGGDGELESKLGAKIEEKTLKIGDRRSLPGGEEAVIPMNPKDSFPLMSLPNGTLTEGLLKHHRIHIPFIPGHAPEALLAGSQGFLTWAP